MAVAVQEALAILRDRRGSSDLRAWLRSRIA